MSLFRISIISLALCVTTSVWALFAIKSNVQNLNKELITINKKLAQEQEEIHMLKAEFFHLSRVQRIEELATHHLQLAVIKPEQSMEDNKNIQLAFSSIGR